MIDYSDKFSEYEAIVFGNDIFSDVQKSRYSDALNVMNASYSEYEKDSVILSFGQKVAKFGMVLFGTIQVCTYDIDGRKAIMANATAGQTFGESLCYLNRKSPGIFIESRENCAILWLDCRKLFSSDSDELICILRNNFISLIANRTLSMNNRIQILSKLSIREKLFTYFSQLSKASGTKIMILPFNREDLAAYIGTNRSALSRELSQMKKEGLIDYHKNTIKILF